mmetsp:Transcript_34056/g.109323  ORF Transcript_34056/g.109323 Transcript_34056/m.109323 type:complete len:1052 (+) Transcript_34056:496-3651(+)
MSRTQRDAKFLLTMILGVKRCACMRSLPYFFCQVVCVAFSADSKYCLAQGGHPEWNLVLWAFDRNTQPIASVKTSTDSGPIVRQVQFSSQDALIISLTGDKLLKILRLVDGHFKVVQLNSQKDPPNYLCHCWLFDDEFVTGTESGEILLFEGLEFKSAFSIPATEVHSAVNCLVSHSKGFICCSCSGMLYLYERARDEKTGFRCKYKLCAGASSIIHLALSPSEESLLCATESYQIYTAALSNIDCLRGEEPCLECLDSLSSSFQNPGPSGSSRVVGIDVSVWKPWIATCGEDRFLRIWNYHQKTAESARQFAHRLTTVSLHPCGLFVLLGCEENLFQLNLVLNAACIGRELFGRSITHCSFSSGGQRFATTTNTLIYVHSLYTRNLVAMLRGDDGQICDMKWDKNDQRILSVTRNGVIVVWKLSWGAPEYEEAISHVLLKTAAATPDLTSIYTMADDGRLREAHADTSRLAATSSPMSHEPASCMVMSRSRDTIFVGGCCPRRPNSVRAISLPLGSTCISGTNAEYVCHASEVSTLAILHDSRLLFSAGADGSVAVFDVSNAAQRGNSFSRHDNASHATEFSDEILVAKAAIVTGIHELSTHRARVDGLMAKHDYQVRLKQTKYDDRVKLILEQYHVEAERDEHERLQLLNLKSDLELEYQKRLQALEAKLDIGKQQLRRCYEATNEAETLRMQTLLDLQDDWVRSWTQETQELCASHKQRASRLHACCADEIQHEQHQQNAVIQETLEVRIACKTMASLVETDGDYETAQVRQSYQAKLMLEHAHTVALRADNAAMKSKSSSMLQDVDNQRDESRALHDRLNEQADAIKGLEREIQGHKKEIREREATLADKDRRIFELKQKNQELEKFKFVLDYKTRELKQQIEPRETEISGLLRQFGEMELELGQYHTANSSLDLMIGELRLKMTSLYKETDHHRKTMSAYAEDLIVLRMALRECSELYTHRELKRGIQKLRDVDTRADWPGCSPAESSITGRNGANTLDRDRQLLERNKKTLLQNRLCHFQMHVQEHGKLLALRHPPSVILTQLGY